MNEYIFSLINQFAGKNSALDAAMIFLADKSPILIALIYLFLWFSGRSKEQKNKNQKMLIQGVMVTAISLVCNQLINLVYFHPRPFATQAVHQLIAHSPDSSFVSDHAIILFSLCCVLWLTKSRHTTWFFVFAIVAAVSRVYVGVHYPTDILGSFVLAGLVAVAVKKCERIYEKPCQKVIAFCNLVSKRYIPD